jgi:hypothetical protein
MPHWHRFTESLDVMGDGSLVLLPTPGHEPPAQSRCSCGDASCHHCYSSATSPTTTRLARRQLPGVGDRGQLASTTDKVRILARRMPGLVILPAHDPSAAQRLLDSTR